MDNFDGNDLGTWIIDPLSEKCEMVNGEVIITDLDRDVASGLIFNNGQEVTDFVISFTERPCNYLTIRMVSHICGYYSDVLVTQNHFISLLW